MKEFEYFKINSVEELKQAYHMFEGKWHHSLEDEIVLFNNYDYRYVTYGMFGIFLSYSKIHELTEIPSPLININNLNKLI